MKDQDILLHKFWKGEASEKEKLELYNFFQSKHDDIQAELWKQFGSLDESNMYNTTNPEALLASIHQHIEQEAAPIVSIAKFSWKKLLVAAAIGFTVLGTAYKLYETTQSSNTIVVKDYRKAIANTDKLFQNNTQYTKDTILEDGTTIQLYPKSALRFKNNIAIHNHKSIILEGKATFTVTHNPNRVFEVITQNIRTTDIGTLFTIDASKQNKLSIVLKEGSIKVDALSQAAIKIPETILKPGQMVDIDFDKNRYVVKNIANNKTTSKTLTSKPKSKQINTTNSSLTFNRISLPEVFQYLEQQYHTTIHFSAEDLKGLSFTGTFSPKDSLETCLDILCSLGNLHYKKNGNQIELYKTN